MRTSHPDPAAEQGKLLEHRFPTVVSDGDELRLELAPKIPLLGSILEMVEAFGEANGVSPRQVFLVNLEIDELITNYVLHSLPKVARPRVQVTLRVHDDRLVLVILDTGLPFNPLEDAPEPDLGDDIDRRRLGGVGLHLVRSYCDNLHYELVDGCNRLTLEHRLHRAEAGAAAGDESEER